MLRSWFHAQGARRPRPTRPATRRSRRPLAIEALEDRLVPVSMTFLVDSAADVVNPLDGVLTLREAITAANANPSPDVIRFNIPGPGPHTIQPTTALPTITDTVVIDGYSQPGASPNTLPIGLGTIAQLKIELNGSLLNDGSSGLVLEGRGSTVKGLVINGFAYPDLGTPGSGRHIPVGGLVLLGEGGHVVAGNFIGTDVSGTVARPNNFQGIYVASSENVIGGSTPAARNLISGNQGFGVHITARAAPAPAPGHELHRPAEHNRVATNLIGTNRWGTQGLANTGAGVMLSVFARNNTIGGTADTLRNVISGNGGLFTPFGNPSGPYQDWPDAPFAMSGGHGSGIHIENLTLATLKGHSVPNAIIGNYIGTNALGTAPLPNRFRGVTLVFTNEATVVDNLISANGHHGVAISGNGLSPVNHRIYSNRIGTDWTRFNALGNGADGIHLSQASHNTVSNNTIAFNKDTGVVVKNTYNPQDGQVYASTGNTISQNSIHTNGLLGIDLVRLLGPDEDGPTPNDNNGDADADPNGLQNYPVITFAQPGPTTLVAGMLNSLPGTAFRLEFFASAAPDPTGFGEGKRFLGATVVTTNGAGNVFFSVSLPAGTVLGEWVTATATDVVRRNTSEISRAVRLPSNLNNPFAGLTTAKGSLQLMASPATSVAGSPAAAARGAEDSLTPAFLSMARRSESSAESSARPREEEASWDADMLDVLSTLSRRARDGVSSVFEDGFDDRPEVG